MFFHLNQQKCQISSNILISAMKRSASGDAKYAHVTTLANTDIIRACEERPGSVLVHQCNCVTTRAGGLAAVVFAWLPAANDYIHSDRVRKPGTAVLHQRVANLYGQRYPGRAKRHETAKQRLVWFSAALNDLATQLPSAEGHRTTVLMPHGIGCGLAGGEWSAYEAAIERWANANTGHIDVIVVRRD